MTENDSIADLDDKDASIILNTYGVDYHGTIAGVETNHDDVH